jgi:ubiquinone biosynthesis accessory factor UbiK
MVQSTLIEELSNKIKEIVRNSPAPDIEKNVHALIQGIFTKMELVSREEFDVQSRLLANTQNKLAELEKKLADLESQVR